MKKPLHYIVLILSLVLLFTGQLSMAAQYTDAAVMGDELNNHPLFSLDSGDDIDEPFLPTAVLSGYGAGETTKFSSINQFPVTVSALAKARAPPFV